MSEMNITANIMVKNEESKIVRCIESVIKFADEVVVVDTGSSDNTISLLKELVRKFGPEKIVLLSHKWENDFSVIRNYMIENSNGRFILQIDADEFLESSPKLEEKKDDIIKMLEKEYSTILCPIIKNTNGSTYRTIPRLFRNDKHYYFAGNIHEELRNTRYRNLKSVSIDLMIHHDGYEKDAIVGKDKLVRNVKLLKYVIEKEPNNFRWRFFWIRENYYAGTNKEEIIRDAEKFIQDIGNRAEYMLVYIILALCYIETNRYEKVCDIVLFLKENGCAMDASFIELTLVLCEIREQSVVVNRIIKDICSIENCNSQLNENGEHVRVQLFKTLFSLGRYKEAFCVLEEVDYYTKKDAVIPELIEIRKNIDIILS